MYWVVETVDVDCDGTAYAWHRIDREPRDIADAKRLAKAGPVDVSRVLTQAEFAREILPRMSVWGNEYWAEEGYASSVHSFC